jgi:hypothetical protein
VWYEIYNTPPAASLPAEPSRCSISAGFGSHMPPGGPGSIPLAHAFVALN